MPDKNKLIFGTNDDTYIAADSSGNIILQHEEGQRVALTSSAIEPATDETLDLGSPTNKFKDLYLSSDSIFIGNTKISSDPTTGALSTVVADEQGQFTAAAAAVGGDVDFSDVRNKQETLLAIWASSENGNPTQQGDNTATFQFFDINGGTSGGTIIGYPSNTVNGPGGYNIPYPLLRTRVLYGSSFTEAPYTNSIIRIKNKENIAAGRFMYDDANSPSYPGYSINPDFDHLKAVFFEYGSSAPPGFGGVATYNQYWRVLDANGNDVNLWDGVNFFNYSALGNLRFGDQTDPTGWGYQNDNAPFGTLPAGTPSFELFEATDQVEIGQSIRVNGDPFSKHGLIMKDQTGVYKRITIDSVGNISSGTLW